jgi:hypothetical protein
MKTNAIEQKPTLSVTKEKEPVSVPELHSVITGRVHLQQLLITQDL